MAEGLSIEEKLRRMQRMFPMWVGVISKAVIEKYGDEGNQVIKNALSKQAQMQGNKVLKPIDDLRDFACEVVRYTDTLGMEVEIEEVSRNRMLWRINRCTMAERWKILGAPAELCVG